MKLRNKKTGEIIDLEQWRFEYYKGSGCIAITNDKNQNEEFDYGTFADMKDEWEDYKPPEPLIKDEKVRKVVRAWAEANDVKCARILGVGTLRCERTGVDIEFRGGPFLGWVTDVKTIDELCGEEEE